MTSKLSSGQKRIARFDGVIDEVINNRVDFIELYDKKHNVNNAWQSCYDVQLNYMRSFPRNGKATLLFDEPDRSLSIMNQKIFWEKMVVISQKIQVIVATHSIFALKHPVIDVIGDYADNCRKAVWG